jgi:two-component system invasion response regulator UvrY
MKIMIVDDHTAIRLGVREICRDMGTETLEAESGEGALELLRNGRPDLIVLDINMPGMSGYEFVDRVCAADPAVRILVFSLHDEPAHALRAMKGGAAGYISKTASSKEIRIAMEHVLSGRKFIAPSIAQGIAILASESPGRLTDRDLEILRLLGEGLSFTEIAQALKISYKTIANSAGLMRAKLGVRKTSDLVRLATEMRLNKVRPNLPY